MRDLDLAHEFFSPYKVMTIADDGAVNPNPRAENMHVIPVANRQESVEPKSKRITLRDVGPFFVQYLSIARALSESRVKHIAPERRTLTDERRELACNLALDPSGKNRRKELVVRPQSPFRVIRTY
jgi:hypothetical protein